MEYRLHSIYALCVSKTHKSKTCTFVLCACVCCGKNSSSHRGGFTRLKIITDFFWPTHAQRTTFEDSDFHDQPLQMNNLSLQAVNTGIHKAFTMKNRYRYSGTLSKSGYIVPATRDSGNLGQCCRSHFTSGENKNNCLDHISLIESESELNHISLVKMNVIVLAIFHQYKVKVERTLFTNRKWKWYW